MDPAIWIWIAILSLVVLAIWGFAQNAGDDQKRQSAAPAMAQDGFVADQVLAKVPAADSEACGVAIDAQRETVCLFRGENRRYIPSHDLIESEVVVDGKSVTKTSRASQFTGAAIGGVLFGGVGAIVGGLSGKTSTSIDAKGVKLRLVVNDMESPIHTVDFIETTNTGKTPVESARREAGEWHELLSAVIKINERNAAHESAPPPQSITTELQSLHEMKESGVLTEAEFEQAKAKALGR